MVLGGVDWLIAVLVSAIVRIWGWGFHVLVNLLVAPVFGYGMPNICNFLITVRGFWFV